MSKTNGKPVLVTTAHRGVFFGYIDGKPEGPTVTLRRARNCVYWVADLRGFLGLATRGPINGCRIGPAVDELELRDVTSIAAVTDEAAKAWESAPWK